MTPEQKLLEDLKNIVGGSATKLASARGQELSQDATPGTEKVASLAEMSIEDIMRDPNFVAGLNYELDKLAAEWVPAAKDILEKTAATKEKKKERKSHEEGETKFPSRWRSFARGAQIGGAAGGLVSIPGGAAIGSGLGSLVGASGGRGGKKVQDAVARNASFSSVMRAAKPGTKTLANMAKGGRRGAIIGGLGTGAMGAATGALSGGLAGLLARHVVRPEKKTKKKD